MERKRDFPSLKDWRVSAVIGVVAGFLGALFIFRWPGDLPPAWGDIPTWISAFATVGLLIGAIITARYAIKAFGEQSREVAILAEQNEREADDRRREQASRVYLIAPRESQMLVKPSAANASDLPVHDAQIWYGDPGGLSGPEDLGLILPKTSVPARRQFSAAQALAHTILTFRDSAGNRWVRMPDGTFDQQKHPAARDSVLAALGLPLPVPVEPSPTAGATGQADEPQAPGAQ